MVAANEPEPRVKGVADPEAAPRVAEVAVAVEPPVAADIPAPPAFFGRELTLDQAPRDEPVATVPSVVASVQPSEAEQPISFGPYGQRNRVSRRAILWAAAGLIAAVGVLVVALSVPTSKGPVAAATVSHVRAALSAVVDSQVRLEPVTPAPEPAPPAASIVNAPPAAASASSAVSAPTEEDDVKININIKPDESLFLYKGRVLGRTPFILKHPRGEKRTYEVSKVGHKTRRVVVTGADTNISFSLQQEFPHPDFL